MNLYINKALKDLTRYLSPDVRTDEKALEIAHASSKYYKSFFSEELSRFRGSVLYQLSEDSETINDVMFARGALNAFNALEKWFKIQESISAKGLDDNEKDDESEMF